MSKSPFPYDEPRVTYETEAAGVTPAGTLITPKEEGASPAVLLITGSGAQDRDETLWGTSRSSGWPTTSRGGGSPCSGSTTEGSAARPATRQRPATGEDLAG